MHTPYAGTYFNVSKMNKPILKDTIFTGTVDGINKNMVGLGNVDNTSDLNKCISTATQIALDSKASIRYVDAKISSLIDGAPDAMNTLNELSNAMNNNTTGPTGAQGPTGATGPQGATGANNYTSPIPSSQMVVGSTSSISTLSLYTYHYLSVGLNAVDGWYNQIGVTLPSNPNEGDWLYVSCSNAGVLTSASMYQTQTLVLNIFNSKGDIVNTLTTPNVGILLVYFGVSGWLKF